MIAFVSCKLPIRKIKFGKSKDDPIILTQLFCYIPLKITNVSDRNVCKMASTINSAHLKNIWH